MSTATGAARRLTALVLAGLLAGCDSGTRPELVGGISLSVNASSSAATVDTWRVSINGPGGSQSKSGAPFAEIVFDRLQPGDYMVTLEGLQAQEVVQRGQTSVTVRAGPPTDARITPSPVPMFALSATGSVTIPQAASGNVTVNISRTNFSGAVDLALETLPAGVTGSFAPNPATAVQATLTLNVGQGAALGTFNVTIKGSASGLTDRSTTVALTIAARPDFALSATPAVTIPRAGSGNAAVTIARTNFTGPLTLTLDNPPAGVTGSFSPNPATTTQSTLTLNVAANAALGTANVTIKGSATGPGDKTTTIALTITEQPDFALSVNPAAFSIDVGAKDQAAVTITRTNFTGAVTLSLDAPPTGISATFDPPAPSGSASTMTVDVAAGVAPGTYNLSVKGSVSGVLPDRFLTVQLTVRPLPDFTLALSPQTVSTTPGGSANVNGTITRVNFAASIGFALQTPTPGNITGLFNPTSTTGTTFGVVLNVPAATAPGIYLVNVRATSGSTVRADTVHVNVTPPVSTPSITSVSPNPVPGLSGNQTLTVNGSGFLSGALVRLRDLTNGGSFDRVTTAFSPTQVQISANFTTAAATWSAQVINLDGGSSNQFTFTVTAPVSLPVVSVTAIDASASEVGPDGGTFRISRAQSSATALAVSFTVSGTATNGSDYQSITSPQTIAAGATFVDVPVTPLADAVTEGTETVVLTLSPSASYTVGTPSAATVTIADAPALPQVTVVATDAAAHEAGPDPGAFTITRTGSTATALVVNFAFTVGGGGCADPAVELSQPPLSPVTIPAGSASVLITVTPRLDNVFEGSLQAVCLALSAGTGYTIGGQASALVRIADAFIAAEIEAGDFHTCGRTQSNEVYCWGNNTNGELGIGSTSPAQELRARLVQGIVNPPGEIVAGNSHSCARSSGKIVCWGRNNLGQVGNGQTALSVTLPAAVQVPAGVTLNDAMAGGASFTCALDQTGDAYCWGFEGDGRLGNGNASSNAVTTPVKALAPTGVKFQRPIVAGRDHACARTLLPVPDQVYCWGNNTSGQVGNAVEALPVTRPRQVSTSLTFVQLAAGLGHTCGRTSSGDIHCWGNNNHGQLGIGSTGTPVALPTTKVNPTGVSFVALRSGRGDHTCARTSAGELFCWGNNFVGQIGNGQSGASAPDVLAPALVQAPAGVVFSGGLTMGQETSCSRTTVGTVYCWGSNATGQVGDGTLVTPRPRPTPVQVR